MPRLKQLKPELITAIHHDHGMQLALIGQEGAVGSEVGKAANIAALPCITEGAAALHTHIQLRVCEQLGVESTPELKGPWRLNHSFSCRLS